MYLNKIFKAKSLTESEKIKVVKAFDRASNVKEVKLTKVLPAAPASIQMNDSTLPVVVSTNLPVKVTTFGQYMGTDKVLDLVAAPVAAASSYVWELPTGVTPIYGTAGTPVVKFYLVFSKIKIIRFNANESNYIAKNWQWD